MSTTAIDNEDNKLENQRTKAALRDKRRGTATAQKSTTAEKSTTAVSKTGNVVTSKPAPSAEFPEGTIFAQSWSRMELRKGVNQKGKWSVLERPQGILLLVLETVPAEKYITYFFVGMTIEQAKAQFEIGKQIESVNADDLRPFSSAEIRKIYLSIDPPNPATNHLGTLESISHDIGRKGVVAFREVIEWPANAKKIKATAE